VQIAIAREPRWIAAEDAGLYRDALGSVPPGGLPSDFLEPVPDALARLVRRFARARGPFYAREVCARFGLAAGQVDPVLRALEGQGALVLGEIRPGGSAPEWCDAEVLRALKRRTLARLRREVAPVDGAALARFLPRWHGLDRPRASPERLLEVARQLEGLALPWSALATEVLPARVAGFSLDQLDLACAGGQLAWVGRGALGARDGRIVLLRPERAAELLELDPTWEPPSALHATLLAQLDARGACFLVELERAVRAQHPDAGAREVEQALWDLVWAGRVSNDTFQPLRALGRAGRASRGRGAWRGSFAGGRWWRTDRLLEDDVAPTQRAHARAAMLLERYGLVSRETALAEELPGGFAPVLGVLRAMEEAGQVRRGWFVEGLSGAQFAVPGAVDRLRADRPDERGVPEVRALPACDPANAHGALLPWPERDGTQAPRPRRVPGAWVGLLDGRLAWYLQPGRRSVTLFPSAWAGDEELALAALRLLRDLPRRGRRLTALDRIDGVDARESPQLGLFLGAGFVRDYRGLIADPAAERAPRPPRGGR
jgi:ATP-dependent Lhr-like helicase